MGKQIYHCGTNSGENASLINGLSSCCLRYDMKHSAPLDRYLCFIQIKFRIKGGVGASGTFGEQGIQPVSSFLCSARKFGGPEKGRFKVWSQVKRRSTSSWCTW